MSDADRELEEGEIHDILRNDRRRAVIAALDANDGEATIRDLSEQIATIESGEDPPPRNLRQSVYVSLHQTHLPKLDSLGVVSYDTETKTVTLHEEASDVKAYMGGAPAATTSWAWMYLGLGLLGLVMSGLTLGNLDPFGDGATVISAILFLVLVAVAAYQLRIQVAAAG